MPDTWDLWRSHHFFVNFFYKESCTCSKFRLSYIGACGVEVSSLKSHPVDWSSIPHANHLTFCLSFSFLISLTNQYKVFNLSPHWQILWCHLYRFNVKVSNSIPSLNQWISTKFTDCCRWQNFRPSLLRILDRLYIVIHKTQKTRTKILPFATVGE